MIRRQFSPLDALGVAETGAASSLAQDLKLFATVWIGGVVFFGTFLA
jgi:hypothetical protein